MADSGRRVEFVVTAWGDLMSESNPLRDQRRNTVRHLEECFEKLAEVRTLAQHPENLER